MTPEQTCKRYDTLKAARGQWESHWQDVADYVYPRRGDFNTMRAPGEKRMIKVFDSSPIHANELLAAGLMGMMVNPASRWFELTSSMFGAEDQEEFEAKEWLATVSDIMYDEMNRADAGFNTAMHEVFLEYGSFGTAAVFVRENTKRDGVLFQSRPLSEIVIAENDDGLIDTVFRKFEFTVRQCVDKWGLGAVSDKVKKLYEKQKFDDKVEILHVIQPRMNRDDKKKDAKNKAFTSTYVEYKGKTVLSDGGFDEWPLPVARFYKNPLEVYGRSPAMTALPDIQMLNQIMKTTIKAAQKSVDPPLIMPSDGFLHPLRTVPGGVNYFDASSGVMNPSQAIGQLPSANPGIGLDMIESLQNRIRTMFFIDQLQLVGSPQMTATEVLQRTEEKLRLMGPILGRIQTELLGPMIDRVFGILLRQGKFPTPPESLQGKNVRVEYISPITQAQKQVESNGFMRAQEVLMGMISINPALMDNLDQDKTFRDTMLQFGVNPDKLRDPKERDTIREQQQQIQQLGQALELAKMGGEAKQALEQGA